MTTYVIVALAVLALLLLATACGKHIRNGRLENNLHEVRVSFGDLLYLYIVDTLPKGKYYVERNAFNPWYPDEFEVGLKDTANYILKIRLLWEDSTLQRIELRAAGRSEPEFRAPDQAAHLIADMRRVIDWAERKGL